MKKKISLLILAICAIVSLQLSAQVTIYGVYNTGRDNDGELGSTYVGWNYDIGKSIFVVPQGIYKMQWDGSTLTTPEKDPAVNVSDFYSGGKFTDNDKALWATNFNLMYGNSGSVYANGIITTIYSRTDDQTEEDGSNRFAVRKWDAETGDLLSTADYPESACLESAGMCVNPVDGKVYGLFYLTGQDLPDEIVNDPDFFVDQEGDATATDAGYCVCVIDLETMKITPVTPGLYYYNFVAFAINAEGRAFAVTSGGTGGAEGDDGKMYDIQGNLTGASLYEFDLETGLLDLVPVEAVDEETGETYTEYVNKYPATGYCSQYKRQSACFSKDNPSVLYWNGYYNSGKGINEYGSWGTLPDKDWRTNGKYDTSLYSINIETGEATRLANITNRYAFAAMWIDKKAETPSVKGDVDGNGKVNVSDVTALVNMILEVIPMDEVSGDVNESGIVNVTDVTELINIILTAE